MYDHLFSEGLMTVAKIDHSRFRGVDCFKESVACMLDIFITILLLFYFRQWKRLRRNNWRSEFLFYLFLQEKHFNSYFIIMIFFAILPYIASVDMILKIDFFSDPLSISRHPTDVFYAISLKREHLHTIVWCYETQKTVNIRIYLKCPFLFQGKNQ